MHSITIESNGDVVACGDFLVIGPTSAWRVARWNGSAWLPVHRGFTNYFGHSVRTVSALPNGDLIVGGVAMMFPNSGPLDSLIRIRGTTAEPLRVAQQWVLASAVSPGGDVLIGGDFHGTGPLVNSSFARLAPACPATAVAYGPGCGTLWMTVDDLPWIGTTYRATTTGVAPLAITVDLLGLRPSSIPLSLLHPTGGPNCSLLVESIVTQPLVPNNGMVMSQFSIPNAPAFVGIVLYNQVLEAQLSPSSSITAVRSSNGLQLTIGAL